MQLMHIQPIPRPPLISHTEVRSAQPNQVEASPLEATTSKTRSTIAETQLNRELCEANFGLGLASFGVAALEFISGRRVAVAITVTVKRFSP